MGNPLLGVLFHWLGGLASASFYVPYRKVRGWAWEVYWITGGIFSWLIAPWIFASIQTKDLFGVLGSTSPVTWGWCVFFGILWGFGGLTFGLTMRYLGLSLGMAVALGLCAFFGTLAPPVVDGTFFTEVLPTTHGQIVLVGLALCLIGICVIAWAGHEKEKDTGEAGSVEGHTAAIAEFDLKKGLLIAIFCGIMSSCFAYGLAAGEPIRKATLAAGTDTLWQGLPVLCVVLIGGAITNLIWSGYLILKNGTGSNFFSAKTNEDGSRPKLGLNYLWCALAGVTWYFQFFFYTMGETQMGKYGFSSWTLHMASIIIFSSLWGFAFKEWKGAKPKTFGLVMLGLTFLIGSTVVIGYGNYLNR